MVPSPFCIRLLAIAAAAGFFASSAFAQNDQTNEARSSIAADRVEATETSGQKSGEAKSGPEELETAATEASSQRASDDQTKPEPATASTAAGENPAAASDTENTAREAAEEKVASSEPVSRTIAVKMELPQQQQKEKPAEPKKPKPQKAKTAVDPNGELPRIALTEAPVDDLDFNLMGEFVGPIEVSENVYEPFGLQIRPIGNGRFEALQYAGGLPGQDSFAGEEPTQLIGVRSGDFVVLSGGEHAIFVEPSSCLLVNRTGKRVGRLERIERGSPTMGAEAPSEATVLFDGSGTNQFTAARMTDEGLLMEGADTLPLFQDFNLHVEFRLPYMPNSQGQKRGNSGCYLQSRYEVQVLDSFATIPVFNGCSSIYRTKAPDLNMCLPPLQWQTYDIQFTAPRWGADGSKLRNGRITVWQNGIKTQDNFELPNKTGAGKVEAPTLLPIRFQNHSDPVRYRNIWIVDRGLAMGEFPVYPTAAPERSAEPEAAAEVSEPARKEKAQKELAEQNAGEEEVPAVAAEDGKEIL
ncbi:MAG: family 16 glycoside hydrolase [Aureliella sp.]